MMGTVHVVVRGTLKPDGSLELDSPPNLPAGPVEVVLRSLASPDSGNEDWWQYLQRVRAELEVAGGPFRTAEVMDKERQDFRDGDDRIEEMYRQSRGKGQYGMSET
jgi:hypothetical protein